jgi:PKD repeat protein
MKKVLIICVFAIAMTFCIGMAISGFYQETNYASDNHLPKVVENKVISGDRINVFAGMFGNFTIDIPVPESPHDLRIYRGYFDQYGLLENITGSTKPISNPIPENQAPDLAKNILDAQYGGLPSDAQLQYSSIMSLEKRNQSTGTVVEEIPYETFVSWHRTVDGLRIEGGSDIIQVELGENGEVIRVYKRWRTYEPLGNVSIIPASKAIDKLGSGEVLNPLSSDKEDVGIYNIHLAYYTDGIDKPEVILEPIWVIYGNTTSDNHVPFYIYARQFANFTATPTRGKVPLTVIFTDTSDASPVKWLWEFGDGTNSTGQNPSHTYTTAGTYNISLRAWNDLGSDTMEKPFSISVRDPAPPITNFTARPATGTAPLKVTFNDTSSNAPTGWTWNFGDNATATVQHPVHTYSAQGNYTVSLIAVNEDGENTRTIAGMIHVKPRPDPLALIDQLIAYINGQTTIPQSFRTMWVNYLGTAKQDLQTSEPGDAVVKMKLFRSIVGALEGWAIPPAQAVTMRDSADAIVVAIDVPVNQPALDQTLALRTTVKNYHLPSATESLLVLELDSAIFGLECGKDRAALDQLAMFSNSVKSLDGKKIPHDQAVVLITKTDAIKAMIPP